MHKFFCNGYLWRGLKQGDEIWQDGRSRQVIGHFFFGELWPRPKSENGNAHLIDYLHNWAEILQYGREAPAADLCQVW